VRRRVRGGEDVVGDFGDQFGVRQRRHILRGVAGEQPRQRQALRRGAAVACDKVVESSRTVLARCKLGARSQTVLVSHGWY
jgi:hypothetical protein